MSDYTGPCPSCGKLVWLEKHRCVTSAERDREERCEVCRFFNWHGYGGNGECRRHAPIVDVSSLMDGRYPATSREGWCGDFERGGNE